LRIVHMSDIHFGGEDAPLVEAVRDFCLGGPQDLIVVSGDLTQYGRYNEFHAAGAWLKTLPAPLMVTPGNHDTPWMGIRERVTAPFRRYEREVGPPAESRHEADGLVALALNSARGWQVRLNWSKGVVSRRQAERAAAHFAAAPPQAVRLLVCHHPLHEPAGAPMTGRVRGGRFAAERLAQARVDLVLSGHVHTPFLEPLPCADAMTYAIGAGTMSLRLRGAPPGFNVIDIADGEVVVTTMVWTGHDLAADQVWTAPLRPREKSAA
jgi:3',5'-cyclic AMP phosphodiesterase CpdA